MHRKGATAAGLLLSHQFPVKASKEGGREKMIIPPLSQVKVKGGLDDNGITKGLSGDRLKDLTRGTLDMEHPTGREFVQSE